VADGLVQESRTTQQVLGFRSEAGSGVIRRRVPAVALLESNRKIRAGESIGEHLSLARLKPEEVEQDEEKAQSKQSVRSDRLAPVRPNLLDHFLEDFVVARRPLGCRLQQILNVGEILVNSFVAFLLLAESNLCQGAQVRHSSTPIPTRRGKWILPAGNRTILNLLPIQPIVLLVTNRS
jgi:hypothetical protein